MEHLDTDCDPDYQEETVQDQIVAVLVLLGAVFCTVLGFVVVCATTLFFIGRALGWI